MFDIEEIIDLAVQIEKNGEKIYRNAIKRVADPRVCSLLQKLADEELDHVEWFFGLKQSIKSSTDDPELMEAGKQIMNSVLGEQAFSLKDVDFSEIDQIDDLMKLAIEFEKDTILFYEMIRPLIADSEDLDHLERIIAEENRHIDHFQEILVSDNLN
jgi:rubrerythrin